MSIHIYVTMSMAYTPWAWPHVLAWVEYLTTDTECRDRQFRQQLRQTNLVLWSYVNCYNNLVQINCKHLFAIHVQYMNLSLTN